MMEGLASATGNRMIVELVEPSRITDRLAPDVAVLLLTQIHYKSGEVWDMNEILSLIHI